MAKTEKGHGNGVHVPFLS